MPMPNRLSPAALAIALLAAGCVAPAQPTPAGTFDMASGEADRGLLGIAATATGGTVTVRPDAPWTGLVAGAALPAGAATHLDFLSRKPDGPVPPGQLKVWYKDGVPFEVTFVPGKAFAIVDGDASDGQAAVAVPAGNFDAYVQAVGKPGGAVAVEDPIWFQRGRVASATGKPSWTRLGGRPSPLRPEWRRGYWRLGFAATGLETGFAMRLCGMATAPALPPIPPQIIRLWGPDAVAPGAVAAINATVGDLNGDVPALAWSAAGPAPAIAPLGGAAAKWTAPATPGDYMIGLTATDRHFTVAADPVLPIRVEAPTFSAVGVNGGGWVLLGGKRHNITVNARQTSPTAAIGRVQVVDEGAKGGKKLDGAVAGMAVAGATATLTGTLSDGTAFRLAVTDGGEGAKAIGPDHATLAIDRDGDGQFGAGETFLDADLAGGNIQVK